MKAVLVLGAESSATRLWTRILTLNGVVGSDAHEQPFDTALPEPVAPIVWRRSFPHGGEWPNIIYMDRALLSRGYSTQAIVTTRDWTAMAKSQVAAGHVPNEVVAMSMIRQAYKVILAGLTLMDMPYVMVSYEALVQRPETTIANTLALLGLEVVFNAQIIRDENAKWLT